MKAKHPPRTRRERAFSSLALLSAGALLASSTILGVASLGRDAAEALAQLKRLPSGAFTQAPLRAYLGRTPGREPHGRGGLWSAARLGLLAEAKAHEGEYVSMEPLQAMAQQHSVAVAPEPGSSQPWEGSSPSAGGSVNTGNGNKMTSVHLLDWKVRGGGSLDFTLYHNSQTNYSDELGAGWTWTYDVYVNTDSGAPVLHWGDGTSIPYGNPGGGGTSPGGGDGGGGFNPRDFAEGDEGYDGLYAMAAGGAMFQSSATTYVAPAGIHDSLVKNADGTWTATKKDGTRYDLNAAGFLTKVTDRNGNAITLTLTANKYVTKITDPTGRYVNVTLNSANKFTGIADSTGRAWTFSINGSGDLASVTWPDLGDGKTYTDGFAYDGSHRIATHTDRRGKAWTFGYNSDGSLASETDPLGHATTYGYGSTATTITDALGHASQDNYSSGNLASRVDASGFSVSYTSRDAAHNTTGWTDARGKAWSATYDAMGNVLTKTDPLGHKVTKTYNGFAEPLTVKTALGYTTQLGYDARGNLTTVTNALGKTVLTNSIGSYGLVSSTSDALAHATTYAYDANGMPTTVTDATSRTTTTGYDALSRPTSVTDGVGNVTSTQYDAWGRPVQTTLPAVGGTSATATTNYLPTGEVASSTDSLNHATLRAYDAAGRLTSVTNPRGDVESYGYDAADRRTSVTNGRGKVRTYAFTDRGDVSSLTMPDGAVESWGYDGAGHATAYVNPLGQTIRYGFDDVGRQTGVDYPTGTDTTFGYDAADRRTSMADATGSTTWAYDAANRETTFSAPAGSQTSGYDDAGRRTSLVGTGISRSWTYDDAGRVLTLGNESSETTSYAYDSAGRLITTTLANGQVTTLGYDARSRQTSVTHRAFAGGATISSESYAYDAAGNLSSKSVDGVGTTYGYDAANQLTSENAPSFSASYTYDANGNRTGKTLNGTTQTYAIDDGDKLTSIAQAGATVKSYAYDAAGRTTGVTSSAGTTTLAYDYESRVTSINGPGVANTFAYNGLDTRIGKVDSGGTSTYRRDGADVTAPVLGDGAAVYTPGVSQRRSGTTTYDLHDQLGTATRQTNASAGVTATRTYDAFGMLVASAGTPQGPFGFAASSGYQEDGNSGLKLLGHRYYDPSTGRFLTRDPAQDGRNWYGYGGGLNNPLTGVDANGEAWIVLAEDNRGVGHVWVMIIWDNGEVWVMENTMFGNNQIYTSGSAGGREEIGKFGGRADHEYWQWFDEKKTDRHDVLDIFKKQPDEYNMTSNNCHDFATSIFEAITGLGTSTSTPWGLGIEIGIGNGLGDGRRPPGFGGMKDVGKMPPMKIGGGSRRH